MLADNRLVTVTGPGGVGKTRLALELGSRVARRLPGGVWVVDLAAVGSPDMLADAVTDGAQRRRAPRTGRADGAAGRARPTTAEPARARQLRAPGRGVRVARRPPSCARAGTSECWRPADDRSESTASMCSRSLRCRSSTRSCCSPSGRVWPARRLLPNARAPRYSTSVSGSTGSRWRSSSRRASCG